MKKMMAVSLFLFSASALTIPNIWTSGFGQGFIEYGISNDTGMTVVVACNVGADPEDYENSIDHSIDISAGDHEVEGQIEFLIDDEAYFVPDSTKHRAGAAAWTNLTEALSKAAEFKVYSDNKLVGEFKPNKKNVKKVLGDGMCAPLF